VSIGSFKTKAEAEMSFASAVADQQPGAWVAPDDGRMTLGGLGPSTVAKCYRLLRAILNTAVEDRHLAANPCAITGGSVEPCEERAIPTIGQVYGLADAVAPRYRALVLLAAFGGLRRGELFGLQRADVDLLHRTVDVRGQRQESRSGEQLIGPPKTVAGRRTLALPNELVPELEEHLARGCPSSRRRSSSSGRRGDRCERECGRRSGTRPGVRSGCPTSTCTTCDTWRERWLPRPVPGPKKSCDGSVTRRNKRRCATSTQPTNATGSWPVASIA
jgi:integrase